MREHDESTEEEEVRLPDERVEDLEPDEDESTHVAGGKLPGKRTPPTVT
jgi:hypothetical protein